MSGFINRQELWHPLSVHLPIAFLLLGTALGIVILLLPGNIWRRYLQYSMLFLFTSGTVLLWLAFYTGNLAYSPVVRTICYPSKLKTHLYWAYITCYSFSAIAVLGIVLELLKQLNNTWWFTVLVVLSLLGSASLTYTGHLGAELVYEQGAGVRPSSKSCD